MNKDELALMAIDTETYKKLNEIAKKEHKSVVDVASEAFKKMIDEKSQMQEHTEKRLLMEG